MSYRVYIKANDTPGDRKCLVDRGYHYQFTAYSRVSRAWALADTIVRQFNVRNQTGERASLMPGARRDVALSQLKPLSAHLIGHAGNHVIVVERIP